MFGRETSNDFIPPNKDYHLEGYSSALEVVEKAKKRLEILQKVNVKNLNKQGLKEFNYQLGMEEFVISFFENHNNIYRAFLLLSEGKTEEAIPFVQKMNPEESIKIYSKIISDFGATRGEEGVLLSLNLRWLPDYIDVRQREGMIPIRINFQPTSHDPLAQGAGRHTFFIDSDKNLWHSKGEKELGIPAATNGTLPLKGVGDSWIEITSSTDIPLKTMRNFNLSAGKYKLELIYTESNSTANIQVLEKGKVISSSSENGILFTTVGGDVRLKITPGKGKVALAGVILYSNASNMPQ